MAKLPTYMTTKRIPSASEEYEMWLKASENIDGKLSYLQHKWTPS